MCACMLGGDPPSSSSAPGPHPLCVGAGECSSQLLLSTWTPTPMCVWWGMGVGGVGPPGSSPAPGPHPLCVCGWGRWPSRLPTSTWILQRQSLLAAPEPQRSPSNWPAQDPVFKQASWSEVRDEGHGLVRGTPQGPPKNLARFLPTHQSSRTPTNQTLNGAPRYKCVCTPLSPVPVHLYRETHTDKHAACSAPGFSASAVSLAWLLHHRAHSSRVLGQ